MLALERPKSDTLASEFKFREQYTSYILSLPPEIQDKFQFVPIHSLKTHAEFDEQQGHHALHNDLHVIGALEFAFRYMEYSSEENDPLRLRTDIKQWENDTGFSYTDAEITLAIAIGLTEHDTCEIATSWEKGINGPRLIKRTDGYRGRRNIPDYDVPEKLSAEVAVARVNSLDALTPEQKMRIGALSHHIVMETTWTQTGNAFGYFVRAADRGSALFNQNVYKDLGACYELYLVDNQILVNPRNEFNFSQRMVPEILPDGVSYDEVMSVVFNGKIPPESKALNEYYPDQMISVGIVVETELYKEGLREPNPQTLQSTTEDRLPVSV